MRAQVWCQSCANLARLELHSVLGLPALVLYSHIANESRNQHPCVTSQSLRFRGLGRTYLVLLLRVSRCQLGWGLVWLLTGEKSTPDSSMLVAELIPCRCKMEVPMFLLVPGMGYSQLPKVSPGLFPVVPSYPRHSRAAPVYKVSRGRGLLF